MATQRERILVPHALTNTEMPKRKNREITEMPKRKNREITEMPKRKNREITEMPRIEMTKQKDRDNKERSQRCQTQRSKQPRIPGGVYIDPDPSVSLLGPLPGYIVGMKKSLALRYIEV